MECRLGSFGAHNNEFCFHLEISEAYIDCHQTHSRRQSFGSLFSVGKSLHLLLAQLANGYGNITCVYLGQNVRLVVVSDAKMAKELLSIRDAQFASRAIHDLKLSTRIKSMWTKSTAISSRAITRPRCASEMQQMLDQNGWSSSLPGN